MTPAPRRAQGRVPGTRIEWTAESDDSRLEIHFWEDGRYSVGVESIEELDSLIRVLNQIRAFAEAE